MFALKRGPEKGECVFRVLGLGVKGGGGGE